MYNLKDPTLKRPSWLCVSCVDDSTLNIVVVGMANIKRQIMGLGQQGHVSSMLNPFFFSFSSHLTFNSAAKFSFHSLEGSRTTMTYSLSLQRQRFLSLSLSLSL